MLTINIDIQDHLINCQMAKIFHIDIAQNTVQEMHINYFDKKSGSKKVIPSHLSRKISYIRLEITGTEFPFKNGSISPLINRNQFPVALAIAFTVVKVHGLQKRVRCILD